VGERGEKEQDMLQDVGERTLASFVENQSGTLAKSGMLLLCTKYPRIRFAAGCIVVNQGIDKAVSEE